MSKRRISALLDDALLGSDNLDPSAQEIVLIRIFDAELMRRLATFKMSCWFNKPDDLSAVECSLSGWSNTGVDALGCFDCGATLKNPSRKEDLARSHKMPKCTENPRGVYSFPVFSIPSLVLAAQHRLDLLLSIRDYIPQIENPMQSSKTYLKCHLCNRQVNLTKYSHILSNTASNSDNFTLLFNAQEEHRWYCPWIRETASDTIDEPGWKQTRDALQQTADAKKNESPSSNDRLVSPSGTSPLFLKRKLNPVSTSPLNTSGSGSGVGGYGERDFSHVQAARASLKSLFANLE
ncbi:UNVERIFIED_CONTAM: hypothetical protein HDU68_006002 [Siphonaria sp. JEL0065]|nr:hypothetical protein HDU68_006002 [Siphonaria sp. JEL0065]